MLPSFRRSAFALFVLAFTATILLGDRPALTAVLDLRVDEFLSGRLWWTPLTAALRTPEGLGMLALLWTLIVQWLIGSRLEGFWGSARYSIMVAVAALVGMVVSALLGLVVPTIRATTLIGTAAIDFPAIVAFGIVFAGERLRLGSREISPVLVAMVASVVVLGFPIVAALAGGTSVDAAWPVVVAPTIAGLVAVVFVQPWRRRGKPGKVERAKGRGQSHLRVVRSADDLLN